VETTETNNSKFNAISKATDARPLMDIQVFSGIGEFSGYMPVIPAKSGIQSD